MPNSLGLLEFDDNEATRAAAKPWSPGKGIEGMEWRLKRKAEDNHEYDYILRVARGRERIWLLGCWWKSDAGDGGLAERNADAIVYKDMPVPEKHGSSAASADFWNKAGLRRFRAEDYQAATPLFSHAFECSGRVDLVMLENAGHAMEKSGEIKPAIELLRDHGGSGEGQINVNLRLAPLFLLDGDIEQAAARFTKCHEDLLARENELLSWIQFLHANGHTKAALDAASWWIGRQPAAKNPRRWLGQSQMLAGLVEESIASFRTLAGEFPDDAELSHELAEKLNEAGQHREALAVLQPILTDNKATARTHLAIAWSHYGRKWCREAKAGFEEALKLSPGDADIEGYIRDTAAKLGQGNHTAIKEILEPVVLPEELRARLAREKAPADFGIGHSAIWLQRLTSWHFEKDKPLKRTVRMKVRINNTEGADEYGTITYAFDPLLEKVHLNRLEVFDDAGRKVGDAKTEEAYIRDEDDGMASRDQVLHVPAPGVAPGCTVEWEITVESLAPYATFPFERVLYANYLPTWKQVTLVTGDTAAIKAVLKQAGTMETLSGKDWKVWVSGPLPAANFEAFSVWAEEEKPYLCLGGEEGSWRDVGLGYLGDLKDRLPVDPVVAKLAEQLTRDCPDEAAKVSTLARHVQKTIAYKAIEFGVRARRPNATSETLRLHYGDCKDTALLLH